MEALHDRVAQAKRRMDVAEARYRGLVQASVRGSWVLWYAQDAELQREFERGLEAGRALLDDHA